jgi:hypothetical protein
VNKEEEKKRREVRYDKILALRPLTLKYIRGVRSLYTDGSKTVGHGAQNMVTVQSGI